MELFGRSSKREVSNQLRLHRAGLEERRGEEEVANNNTNNNNTRRQQEEEEEENENLCKESRARRRKRVRSYCQEEEVEDVPEEVKTEKELLLAGVAVTKEVDCCQDCGASLPSEWHRPPNRHDCQAMSETVCQVGHCSAVYWSPSHLIFQYCKVTVRGSWYLPPSRHHCPGSSTPTRRKRRRVTTDTTCSPGPSSARKTEDHTDFCCPLVDCSRQCDSKKLLMLHLAISHYQEELEDRYIKGQYCITMINYQLSINNPLSEGVCGEGGLVCPDCGDIQPGNKLNLIRHLAMDHEVVMELVDRDVFQSARDNDEDFNVDMA